LAYSYFDLNNPGNIGYSPWTAGQGGTPSSATDTGHKIASFSSLAGGYAAMAALARNKYTGGATSLNQLIAGKNGWTPGNTIAAGNIAATMGIKPTDDLNLTDPAAMAKFQRALTLQETGSAQQWNAFSGGAPGVTRTSAAAPGTTLTSSVPPDPWMVTGGYASAPGSQTSPNGTGAPTVAAAPGSVMGPPGMLSGSQPPGAIAAGLLPGSGSQQSTALNGGLSRMTQGLRGGSGSSQGQGAPPPPPAPPPLPAIAHLANMGAPSQLAARMQALPSVRHALATAAQSVGTPLATPAAPYMPPNPNLPPIAQSEMGQLNMMTSPYYGTSIGSLPIDASYGGYGGFGGWYG
jgi:hypothetical protein